MTQHEDRSLIRSRSRAERRERAGHKQNVRYLDTPPDELPLDIVAVRIRLARERVTK